MGARRWASADMVASGARCSAGSLHRNGPGDGFEEARPELSLASQHRDSGLRLRGPADSVMRLARLTRFDNMVVSIPDPENKPEECICRFP